MRYVSSYTNQLVENSQQSKFLERALDEVFSDNNIKAEIHFLNESEAVLPERLSFDLHFDMIINDGAKAVSEYYKNLLIGKNNILEKAKVGADRRTFEKISQSQRKLKQRLVNKRATNENAAAPVSFSPAGIFGDQLSKALGSTVGTDLSKITIAQPAAAPTSGSAAVTPAAAGTTVDPTAAAATSAEALSKELGVDPSFDTALSGGEYLPDVKAGILSTIKNLWNAITEDSSPIGILHLVLDLIGLFGDAIFPGVGVAADIINGIIYFIRGKIVLGLISLVAAVIVGGGDALKIFKPVGKFMDNVLGAFFKRGAKGASDELMQVPVKQRGMVVKGLNALASLGTKALGTSSKILNKFFEKFLAKISGWIPGIGKPLAKFFEKIGSYFAVFAKKVDDFGKNFSKIGKEADDAAAATRRTADDAATAAGRGTATTAKAVDDIIGDVTKNGGKFEVGADGLVKAFDKEGKVIGTFEKEFLTNPKAVDAAKKVGAVSRGTADEMANFLNVVAKREKTTNKLAKFFKATFNNTVRLSAFIGKQYLKIAFGVSKFKETGYTEEQAEVFGSAAMTDWANERIRREQEASGAVYDPEIMLDSSEAEVMENITKYQNNYARITGQPKIIHVVYDRYGNEGVREGFEDFWRQIDEETIKTEDVPNTSVDIAGEMKKSNESVHRLKFVLPYSKFI